MQHIKNERMKYWCILLLDLCDFCSLLTFSGQISEEVPKLE